MNYKDREFHLYYIKDEYINYLREFEKRVYYNKNQKRPYVGTICIFQGKKYFVPMSSPKEKHIQLNPNIIDIYKIKEGKLGILNINNMIPIPDDAIINIDFGKEEKDYAKLLSKQIRAINSDRKHILEKISKFFTLYKTNKLYENILQRTCDFELLNKKCDEWKDDYGFFGVKEESEEYQYTYDEKDYRVFAY